MTTASKSITFLLLTFALSWGVCIGGAAMGMHRSPLAATAVLTLMMAGPAIAAFICVLAFEKGRRREALGLKWTPNLWWLGAWALAVTLAALSIVFTLVLSGRHFVDIGVVALAAAETALRAQGKDMSEVPPFLVSSEFSYAMALIVGPLINTPILVFTEELGWRGYLHDLWHKAGFWKASLATGAIWGLWHAPAILLYGLNYPANREIGVGLFIVFCALLAPLMTFIRDKGRSVIAPAITHGSVNALGGLTIASVSAPAFPWNGIVGIGGFAALAVLVAAVALTRPSKAAP